MNNKPTSSQGEAKKPVQKATTSQTDAKKLVPKPTRMAYINFVQAFRQTYQGAPKKVTEMAKLAGAAWNQMSDQEKQPFKDMADEQKALPRSRSKPKRRLQKSRGRKLTRDPSASSCSTADSYSS